MAPGFIAIGSGPAGVSAAETFRSKHPHIPVRILTVDPALPYAKPPLSKDYLCGREAKLDLHSAGWFVRNDVDLIRGITVDHIDLARQEVVTAGGRRYPYWHLVVACGANAVPLNVPGAEAALTLRSFADAVALKMAARYAESAVVIGGGLIGCEAAACLAGRGVSTTLVAAEARSAATPVRRSRPASGWQRSCPTTGFASSGRRPWPRSTTPACCSTTAPRSTATSSSPPPACAPTSARRGGRPGNRDGRIVVDEHMHTSARNVYAAGDVALAHNVTAGRRIRAEHWRDAAQQGLVAGLTAAGFAAAWDKVPGFSCTIGESVLKYRGWGTATSTAGSSTTTTGSRSGTSRAARSSACSPSTPTTTTGAPTSCCGRTRRSDRDHRLRWGACAADRRCSSTRDTAATGDDHPTDGCPRAANVDGQ